MKITFTVPGQPVGKGRARIGRVGGQARMFTPDKTVRYENLVALAARDAMGDATLMTGPTAVVMTMLCAIPASWSKKKTEAAIKGEVYPTTKPDVDNVAKGVFDAMNGVVWKDDTQVVELFIAKSYSHVPCVIVTVTEVNPNV